MDARAKVTLRTKIHVSVDGPGYSLRFILTADQRHDIIQAKELMVEFDFEQLNGDTA